MKLEKRYELQKKQLENMTNRVINLELELKEKKQIIEDNAKLNAELLSLRESWQKEIRELKIKSAECDILLKRLRLLLKNKEK